MRPAHASLIASAAFLATSVVYGNVDANGYRGGTSDFSAFFFGSLPGAAGAFALAWVLLRMTESWNGIAAIALHASAGTAAGFAWTILVAASLGPWFRAFSFPVVSVWMVAGGFALTSACVARRPRQWPTAIVAAALVGVGVAALESAARVEQVELLVFLKPGVTPEDVDAVRETVLCEMIPGRGFRHRAGITMIGRWDVAGRPHYKIGLAPRLDAKRREDLVRSILASEFVAKVEEFHAADWISPGVHR